MSRDDAWSAKWSCEKLISHDEVISAEPVGGNLIQLSVKELEEPVLVFAMSKPKVAASDVQDARDAGDIEFAMNIPKNAVLQRGAIEAAESIPIGLGGLGDLYIAVNEREFRHYLPKETRFILRGLEQHSAVSKVVRENNRTYLVERHGMSEVRVLALNDYDLTAEAVRDGIEKFGKCDIVLMSNPNCRPSVESFEVAKHSSTRILKWGQLLGALNH